ncbi:MAG: putative phage tail assembly chaperone [Motiliproteus sp.]
MAVKAGKKMTIQAGEQDLKFTVTVDDYHGYQNAFQPDNKVAPSRNFLTRTVDADDKEALEALLDQGYAAELATTVAGNFKPALEIKIKN